MGALTNNGRKLANFAGYVFLEWLLAIWSQPLVRKAQFRRRYLTSLCRDMSCRSFILS